LRPQKYIKEKHRKTEIFIQLLSFEKREIFSVVAKFVYWSSCVDEVFKQTFFQVARVHSRSINIKL
jgi:hypothetical protein